MEIQHLIHKHGERPKKLTTSVITHLGGDLSYSTCTRTIISLQKVLFSHLVFNNCIFIFLEGKRSNPLCVW